MTPSEYSRAYGYSRSSVMRWLQGGLIDGARKGDLLWHIPEGARPRYQPRKKANRTQRDNMFDLVRALDRRLYVDARTLGCSDADFRDLLKTLRDAGVIEESDVPADGRWHTGYRLTERGISYAALPKRDFVRNILQLIVEAGAEGFFKANKA